ncbi:MAG: hypothetical protein IKC11_05360 [Clostridia bacterium]|nr:hypothetical protein [Clostridia bacterium]
MNINLHNKFEITLRNKTYTAYNTLLNSVYDKITNLSQYTSHIAIGTGTKKLTQEEHKLGNYLRTFTAETEEIQADISKGTLYIVKTTTIPEDDNSIFSFSELGLTDCGDFSPTIFNHVLLTDSNGEPVSITRNPGDLMQIKVTIYLELTQNSLGLFTIGENPLIKQILGEDLKLEDNSLYAIRGDNLTENIQTARTTPDLSQAIKCNTSYTQNQTTYDILFSAELGEGTTEEILICYANTVCMRINTLETNAPTQETLLITPTNKVLEVGENIKEINSVTDDIDQTQIENFKTVKYAKKITDKITNLFDLPFTYNSTKFVSKDGNLIAFIKDSTVHLYKYKDYSFEKVKTNILAENTIKLVMFEDIIVQFLTTSPHIKIYKIVDGATIEKNVDLTFYNASSYSYDWLDVDANLMLSGTIKIGAILNNADYTPIVINLTPSGEDKYIDSIVRPQLTSAKKIYTIYKNNYGEPALGFLTDTYAGGTYYFQEEFYDQSSYLKDSNEIQYNLLAGTSKLLTSGKTILAQKESSPYLYVYYYPDYNSAPTNISQGVDHFVSCDGNYIIIKNELNEFKIYNLHQEGVFIPFEKGFPEDEVFLNIKDCIFVGNLVLILTETEIYAYALKTSNTRIEALPSYDKNYSVSYNKYNLLGNKKLEGVKIELKLSFN